MSTAVASLAQDLRILAKTKTGESLTAFRKLLRQKVNLSDRCDRCEAQSKVFAINPNLSSSGILQFCNHHGNAHEEVLKAQGFDLITFSDLT